MEFLVESDNGIISFGKNLDVSLVSDLNLLCLCFYCVSSLPFISRLSTSFSLSILPHLFLPFLFVSSFSFLISSHFSSFCAVCSALTLVFVGMQCAILANRCTQTYISFDLQIDAIRASLGVIDMELAGVENFCIGIGKDIAVFSTFGYWWLLPHGRSLSHTQKNRSLCYSEYYKSGRYTIH
jgi:hypothetical protein